MIIKCCTYLHQFVHNNISINTIFLFSDVQYNVTVKNAWKLHETHKDKWYLLFTKTPAEKQRWIKAFQKERERVKEDQENSK